MPTKGPAPRLAVLIDADNAVPRHARHVFDEIATLGEAAVRRIYGDFSTGRLAAWNDAVRSHAIVQHQQPNNTTGKNAADIALVIDAMDLMHKGKLDGFCLVSSDSDFTRLALRLREEGLDVYGFGEHKTPESFRNSCKRFIYVENLEDPAAPPEKPAAPPKETESLKNARAHIAKAIGNSDEEWVNLAEVGQSIRNAVPDFDPRTWGCSNLSALVKRFERFEVRQKNDGGTYVRRKVKGRQNA